MNLASFIPLRKSVRSYTEQKVDSAVLARIEDFIRSAKPLEPGMPVRWEFVDRAQVKCIFPWIAPHCIAIFTTDEPSALENVGFIFQQLDLFLNSLGLGACWLGLGRPGKDFPFAEDDMRLALMITFGHPKGEFRRSGPADFRRKALAEISDIPDSRLEWARLAPSSINSQPWRFTHEGETIHVHCIRRPLVKSLRDMNRIDMGIALAHIYLAHPDSFRFFRAEGVQCPGNCAYTGSFML